MAELTTPTSTAAATHAEVSDVSWLLSHNDALTQHDQQPGGADFLQRWLEGCTDQQGQQQPPLLHSQHSLAAENTSTAQASSPPDLSGLLPCGLASQQGFWDIPGLFAASLPLPPGLLQQPSPSSLELEPPPPWVLQRSQTGVLKPVRRIRSPKRQAGPRAQGSGRPHPQGRTPAARGAKEGRQAQARQRAAGRQQQQSQQLRGQPGVAAARVAKFQKTGQTHRSTVGSPGTKRSGRWEAHIWIRDLKKQVYLGGYEHEDHAAEAYDVAALKTKGRSTPINFDKSRYQNLLSCMDAISLEELVMAVRRQSQGFSRGSSTFRGVTSHPSGRWESRIGVPGSRHVYLGLFDHELQAARAYDRALVRLRGFAAATNCALADYTKETEEHDQAQEMIAQMGQPLEVLLTVQDYERWVKHGNVEQQQGQQGQQGQQQQQQQQQQEQERGDEEGEAVHDHGDMGTLESFLPQQHSGTEAVGLAGVQLVQQGITPNSDAAAAAAIEQMLEQMEVMEGAGDAGASANMPCPFEPHNVEELLHQMPGGVGGTSEWELHP